MDLEFLKDFFLWSTLINFGVLLLWFAALVFARSWMHRMHSRWFPMSMENFSRCHYMMYGGYKLAIIVFNMVPYIALRIAG